MIMKKRFQDELKSLDEIYEDEFDDRIEQSAIYKEVFFPCIKKTIVGIVLTPVCDIYQDKADFIRMAGFIPAELIFEKWLQKKYAYTDEQIAGITPLKNKKKVSNTHTSFVNDLLKQREIRYHFISSCRDEFPHSFVDFQLVESLPLSDVNKSNKVAVMKSPWKQSVLARYAAYCGRVGTKEYSTSLTDLIMNRISRLTWPQ